MRVYLCQTKTGGRIVGCATLADTMAIWPIRKYLGNVHLGYIRKCDRAFLMLACLSEDEIVDAFWKIDGSDRPLWMWKLSNPQPLDIRVNDLGVRRVPRNWCYCNGGRDVVIAIRERWAKPILDGRKTIELRWSRPRVSSR